MNASRVAILGLALGIVLVGLLPFGDSPPPGARHSVLAPAPSPLSQIEPAREERGADAIAQEQSVAVHGRPAETAADPLGSERAGPVAKLGGAQDVVFSAGPRRSSETAGSDGDGKENREPTGRLCVAERKLAAALASGSGLADEGRAGDCDALRQPPLEELTTLVSWNDPVGEWPRAARRSDWPPAPPSPPLPTVPLEQPVPPAASFVSTGYVAEPYPKSGCDTETCAPCRGDDAWSLPEPAFLKRHRVEIGGWIDQGVSVVANQPADRFNGPVTFNDRDGEWMVNQVWLYAEREIDTDGCGWDIGGRVDFVYGTDARFTQAAGLETHGDGSPKWNGERFYQAALPQLYLDVGFRDWTLRMGHFFTIIGYEVVAAPDNFFYSHAYTMQYGEPFTHTGLLLFRDFGPYTLTAGWHRGNDQFEDADGLDALNFLGGVSWTNPAENLSLAFALSATEDGPGANTTIYSLVGTWNVADCLTYVVQHDYGQSTGLPGRARSVEWYGLNQYLLYDINDCWGAGLRFEWFRDDDGARVTGLGDGNLATGPFVGNFYEITAGLNWHPHANVTVRPEARWDWFDGAGLPYDAGDRGDQFLVGCDLICTY